MQYNSLTCGQVLDKNSWAGKNWSKNLAVALIKFGFSHRLVTEAVQFTIHEYFIAAR